MLQLALDFLRRPIHTHIGEINAAKEHTDVPQQVLTMETPADKAQALDDTLTQHLKDDNLASRGLDIMGGKSVVNYDAAARLKNPCTVFNREAAAGPGDRLIFCARSKIDAARFQMRTRLLSVGRFLRLARNHGSAHPLIH